MQLLKSSLLALAAIFATSVANATELPDLKSVTDEQLIALLGESGKGEKPEACNRISPIYGEMLRRPAFKSAELQDQKLFADFQCALESFQWVTAYRLLPDAQRIAGNDFGDLGFYIALYSDHSLNAAERLMPIIDGKDSQPLIDMSEHELFQLLRDLWKGEQFEKRNQIVTALMQSRHYKKLPDEAQVGLVDAVISEEGRTGNFKQTPKLLGRINSPFGYDGYLALKKYQAVWPEFEKAAGPNLLIVTERGLKADMARYKADPTDRKAFQQLAHALLAAGKFEDIIAHVATFDHSAESILKATEDDGWALNVEAYALDALGRGDEASAIFDKLAAIPYNPQENGWLVSFVINRGSRLIELGRWEVGLKAATLAGEIAEKSGSPYAKMLVMRDKICALNKLGRGAEAAVMVKDIFDQRKDSQPDAATAQICAGDIERAAQIVIEALRDPVYAETMATELQKPEFRIFYTRSKLQTLRDALMSRPDVRAAFDKVARDIPDQFIPLAGKRRDELKASLTQ
jgi:hypothetical protein